MKIFGMNIGRAASRPANSMRRAPEGTITAINSAADAATARAIAGAAHLQSSQPIAGDESGPVDPLKVSPRPEPTLKDPDSFTRAFASKLYLGENFGVSHGKPVAPRPKLALKLLGDWFDSHSPTVDLAEIAKEFHALVELQHQIRGTATIELFHRQQLTADNFQSREAIAKSNHERGTAINTRKLYLSIRTAELLVPVAEAIQADFRAMAKDLDKAERKVAESAGIEFHPTEKLQAAVWIGVIGAMQPTTSLALHPIADSKRVREYWVQSTVSRGKSIAEIEREAAREREKNVRFPSTDVPDLTETQKAEMLEKINALADEVRTAPAPSHYRDQAIAEHELAKAAERAKLKK